MRLRAALAALIIVFTASACDRCKALDPEREWVSANRDSIKALPCGTDGLAAWDKAINAVDLACAAVPVDKAKLAGEIVAGTAAAVVLADCVLDHVPLAADVATGEKAKAIRAHAEALAAKVTKERR